MKEKVESCQASRGIYATQWKLLKTTLKEKLSESTHTHTHIHRVMIEELSIFAGKPLKYCI